MVISQDRLDQIQQIKNEVGWSWDTLANRLGWTPHQMRQVRGLKVPVADEHIAYVSTVLAAVNAVPVPGPEVIMPQPPAVSLPQDIKVMLLDDIATKLAEEYAAVATMPGATADEIAGARWMVGRLAERCGVTEEVRRLTSGPKVDAAIPLLHTNPAPRDPIGDPALEPDPEDNFARHGGIGTSIPVDSTFHIARQPAIATTRNPFAPRERVPMTE